MSIAGSAPSERGELSFYQALPSLLLIVLVFFFKYTDKAILGPLLVHMQKDLDLGHVGATSLLLFFSGGFSSGIFLSGFATARFMPRRIISCSVIGSGIILLLLAEIRSITEARVLLIVMGLVGGFYLTAAMATLRGLVRPEDWSRAIAVHELAPAISFIIAPLIAENAQSLWGWQGAMRVMGVASIVVGVMFLFFRKSGGKTTDMPSLSGVMAAVRTPAFWVFIWLFAIAVAGEFAPYSVLSLSLTAEQGISSAESARLLSISRIIGPFGVLFGGWAAGRLGAKRTVAIFLVTQGLALAAMALPLSLIGKTGLFFAMTAQSAAPAFVFPALFTIFARSFPYERQSMSLAIAVPAAIYFGTGIAPLLLGASGQYWNFGGGYLLFGLFTLATLPILRFREGSMEK